ncbi:MAG: N-acetylglutaminylglutamine amidotransferase [Chromatiales bacterium]|nr:N-acetylglutaminylglutamine amidotransferase [Chromatiales bacterium]
MCGIAGEFYFGGRKADADNLRKMLAHISFRGPDSQRIWCHENVGLAHARLAIIDLSESGNQPMSDDALGLQLVFNGVIYNYKTLRAQLKAYGYRFFSTSDSEVILKAYHRWQAACVERLDGIFAFAVWDKYRNTLLLARDRLGIKPLYYARTADCLRFASNPQALLSTDGIDTQIDALSLHHHLSLHAVVPAPRTLLRGIRKLEPAHTMSIDDSGNSTKRCYWSLPEQIQPMVMSENEWLELIESELLNAVKKRFEIADVDVGVLLSGGLDSSLLVALLAKLNISDINTYTIGFDSKGKEFGDEFVYSDMVVKYFDTQHHRFSVSDTQLYSRLGEAIAKMAEPMPAQDCIAFYLLAEQVAADIKVVQSGQGADEVFGGYFWYPKMHQANGSAIERFKPYYFDRSHKEYLDTVTRRWHIHDNTSALVESRLRQINQPEFLNTVLCFDIGTLIVDDPVKRVDNMMMAWGIEARVPFLDQHLVERACAMPATLKLRDGGKYCLKKIARRYLPVEIIERKKGYFPVPALKYIQGIFFEMMCDTLNSRACRERDLFEHSYINHLLNSAEDQLTPIQGNKLWHCALLEMWLQTHVDKHSLPANQAE